MQQGRGMDRSSGGRVHARETSCGGLQRGTGGVMVSPGPADGATALLVPIYILALTTGSVATFLRGRTHFVFFLLF